MAGFVHDVLGELEQKLNKTIDQRFAELTFVNGVDVPTTFDLEPGADTVSVDIVQSYGQAKLLSQEASDIPLVTVNITKDKAPIVMAVAGYGMGFQAERAYSFSGKSALVSDRSVLAVRRVIDERLHYFSAYGDRSVGATGFYNNAAITPVNSSFNPNTATFTDWITFLMDLVLNPAMASVNTVTITDIILSQKALQRCATVTDTQNTQLSALQAVRARLDALGGVYSATRIMARPESNSVTLEAKGVMAAATNKDRVVVYRKEPMTLARQMEASIAQMMPAKYTFSIGDGRIVYPMFSTSSATQIYETNGVQYIDIVKAT